MPRSGFFNVGVLALSNALAFAVTPMMMLVGSLIGADLAPSKDWSTLPIALIFIGTAVGVYPATQLMQRLGRKSALWVFMGLGVAACLVASHSLAIKSFSLFCLCTGLIGFTNAALQQIRFAAMECVDLSQAATAASMVMLGGVIAAIVGPELAVVGRTMTSIDYQASFWLVAVCITMAALLLSLFSPKQKPYQSRQVSARPIVEILKSPAFCLAVASGATAYIVMSFIMTGTPISMHNHHGHSLIDTKWVIQSHIAAMFLPSLISPWLFRLIAARGMMIAGLLCYLCTIIVGCLDTSVMGFWFQLVLLGIGWNFLFVAGTALLPGTYQEGDQFKAQAFNDGVVFAVQALASLSAGWAITHSSWATILLFCLLPVGSMVALLIWNTGKREVAHA